MRKILTLGAALLAWECSPAQRCCGPARRAPFPATTSGPVFVAAQTVTATGCDEQPVQARLDRRVPCVRARRKAKTQKMLVAKDVKYFYVTIPNQPNVKLTYQPKAPGASARMAWIGAWTVPTAYRPGMVNFKMLVKAESKRTGSFVQMPVATSTADDRGDGPRRRSATGRPPGSHHRRLAKPDRRDLRRHRQRHVAGRRTQTRGRMLPDERVQARRAGRHSRLGLQTSRPARRSRPTTSTPPPTPSPASAAVPLAYGAHGAVGNKVIFWAAPWLVPPTFPLGDVTIHVTFKTDAARRASTITRSRSSRKPKEEGTTVMTITTKRVVGTVVAGSRAARAGDRALAAPGPVTAPAIPGAAALPGPVVAAGKPRRRCRSSRPRPTSRWPGRRLTISGAGLPGEQGRAPDVEHRDRRLAARRAPRQRRLPRPQGQQVPVLLPTARPTRAGAFSVKLEGAAGLRRHPRHLRRGRRHAGREGRLPRRPARDDDPEEGPDRHADHDHLAGLGSTLYEGAVALQLRQQVRRRR